LSVYGDCDRIVWVVDFFVGFLVFDEECYLVDVGDCGYIVEELVVLFDEV